MSFLKTFWGVDGRYLTVITFWSTKLKNYCLHWFHRGDEDPDCHDHPFDFSSLILWGGYREYAPDGTFIMRGFLSFARHEATHKHRVELLGKRCLTLCVKTKPYREWGFWPDHGKRFVHWRKYIVDKGMEPV